MTTFTCPKCSAQHTRGPMLGTINTYRCLSCGYTGHGHHPDAGIDAEVEGERLDNEAWNMAHGMAPAGDSQS